MLNEEELAREIERTLWAKSEPFKPLWMHLLETGIIAQELISSGCFYPVGDELAENFGMPRKEIENLVGYIGSVHDLGKCYGYFQKQAANSEIAKILDENNVPIAETDKFRHELHGCKRLKKIWKDDGFWTGGRFRVRAAEVIGYHHQGKKKKNTSDGINEKEDIWQNLQKKIEKQMRDFFTPPQAEPAHMDAACMMILGVLITADWIASGEEFSSTDWHQDWQEIEKKTRYKMRSFLQTNHLQHHVADDSIRRFTDLWPQIPAVGMRPLQKVVEKIFADDDETPLGVIIEAPMGCGKTEAGLYAALRLAQRWGKEGFYVALPTSATSNQMYGRMNAMLASLHDTSAKLMHGMAWMMDELENSYNTDDREEATLWTAPMRRGLIAPFAVGTVDQVMMSAMRTKYGVLRLTGLAQKVLIIDEIHAYDAYMSSIIEKLLSWCKVLHIPVVMLSATLPNDKKMQYASVYYKQDDLSLDAALYPGITLLYEDREPRQIHVDEKSRNMKVRMRYAPLLNEPDEIAGYLKQRLDEVGGGCFCILVNTVKEAQSVYKAIKDNLAGIPTILFHARFSASRRQEIEQECLKLLGKDKAKRPHKMILVATQVVEQSLDLDFDEMISDICPIDLLLQRMGRIWRHDDTVRPQRCHEPTMTVLLPRQENFGSTEMVYPKILLRKTMRILENRNEIYLPRDISLLVQEVYSGTQLEDSELEDWLEYNANNELMEGQAAIQELPKPSAKKFCFADDSAKSGDLFFSDDDSSFLPARTRLGESSWRIAIVPVELYRELLSERRISKKVAKKVLGYSLSIAERVMKPLLDKEIAEGFEVVRGEGLLQGTYIFPGNKGICHFMEGGFIEMNNEMGFICQSE